MIERRKGMRKTVNLTVRKHIDGNAYFCRACEISSTGIRLKRIFDKSTQDSKVDIEVPLVEGKLITALAARRIWQRDDFEAFEFLGPSLAQKVVLEMLYGEEF